MVLRKSIECFSLTIGLFALFSCSRDVSSTIFHYQSEIIAIRDLEPALILDTTQYAVTYYTSLQLPSEYKYLKCDKMEYVGGFFYLLDTEYNKTVFVFDSQGHFVSRIGQRGRSASEYLDSPTDFFVNPRNDQVMVYERNAHRVHVYDQNGNQIELHTFKMWPYAVGTLFNGYYMAAFDYKEAGKGLQLGVFDRDERIVLPIITMDSPHVFINNERAFVLHGDFLYHIPHFSDSVLIFKSDTLSRVIHLQFQSQFVPSDVIRESNGGNLDDYKLFRGITSVSGYYETNSFNSFSYSKSHVQIKCIIDKRNGMQYHFTGSPFRGLFPGHRYTMVEDSIFWLVTEDDIADLNYALQHEIVKKELSHTYSIIRDIIQNKYPFPLILKVRLDHQ
ncbi:MAG: 6-bladed beta-propeller [Bacteroidales bacterium]|nr:6-bladed beta-propeller [Bacteroidales bacterium]